MAFVRFVRVLAMACMIQAVLVHSQISTPCTQSLITSFTPCMNLLTNSSANGTSPTSDCCDSLRSLMSNGMDCLCLVVTGNVPFQLPINRSLAISLPRACNMPGLPVQCEASVAPIPAPGPMALGPTMSPNTSPSPSSTASTVNEPMPPTFAPEADTMPALVPPSPTVNSEAPTENTGIRPVLTPSAANPSCNFSTSLLFVVLGVIAIMYNY